MKRMQQRNIGQLMRSNTLRIISGWIEDAKSEDPEAEINSEALIRKICLVIGATRKKAEEYLEVLGVE
jgi:hypothetical protein